jgi:hypothetical protein
VGCFCSARFCREKKAAAEKDAAEYLEYVQFYTVCVQVYLGILNLICFQTRVGNIQGMIQGVAFSSQIEILNLVHV